MILTLAARRPAFAAQHVLWLAPPAFLLAALAAAGIAHFVSITASALAFSAAAFVLLLLTAWRPAVGCAVLALAVPLTAGLGRDTVLPLLRVSEAATLAVAAGALLHQLPRRGAGRFLGLDIAIAAYIAGAVVIPSLVLVSTRTSAGVDSWRYVLQPIQYVVIYWLFSRASLSGRSLKVVINLAMSASVVAALIGLAQLGNVPGVRNFVDSIYPLGGGGEPLCAYGVCRPTSILDHAPAFGAYALLNFSLALALAARRHPAFPSWWLATVMAVNAAAVLASQTQAAILGLLVATILITWHARHISRAIAPTAVALVIGLIIFLPQLSARIQQQTGGGAETPVSLAIRYEYWSEYFVPALAAHALTGTGTVIPGDIPARLTTFVDDEYLRQGFRAGLPGVALLLLMYGSIGVSGWRARKSNDVWIAAFGAAAVSCVAVMAIMGTTAEYLTFAGVSQMFWMATGLFAGVSLAPQALRRPSVVIGGRAPSVEASAHPALRATVAAWGRRLLPDRALVKSSATVFAGNATARLLGFLFSLATARLLLPTGFGAFAFALTVATIGSILLFDTPIGLSRTLASLRGRHDQRDAAFSNTVGATVTVLSTSIAVTLPAAFVAGLRGWMLAGVAATLIGNAAYVGYRETMRGQERYIPMVAIYVVANLLELVAILIAAALGHRSPSLFLILYGLSYVVALLILLAATPLGLQLRLPSISVARVRTVIDFVAPLYLQTAFLTVWLGADLVIVNRLMSSASAGQYAAAKTLANVFYLAPNAIGGPLLPKVASLVRNEVRPYVLRVLTLVAVLTAPLLAALIIFRHPVFQLVYGSRYAEAAAPFAVLAVAMSLYGVYQVLEHTWIGRGRPVVDTVATGAGALVSLALLFVLVPRAGLNGAALAFLAGAIVQVLVIGGITLVALGGRDASDMIASPEGSDGRSA